MDSKTWEDSRCRHHVDFSKWAKKRPAIHPLVARPKTRSFCTFRNLFFDRSTTEHKPLYLTSFTGKKSSQSQGKGHCQLLPKDWKTASHALTGDPLAPQQPPVAMGRHYAYAPLRLYANAQGRHETGGVLSLFSSFSFDISILKTACRGDLRGGSANDPRADHDRVGWSPWQGGQGAGYSACHSSICLIFSTSQNEATALVFKHKRPLMWPTFLD